MVKRSLAESQSARSKVQSLDPIWAQIRTEAAQAMAAEPALGSFIFATVLSHAKLEDAICHRLAQRLNHTDVDAGLISGFPLVSDGRKVSIVPGQSHNEFAQSKIDITINELREERECVKDLLS